MSSSKVLAKSFGFESELIDTWQHATCITPRTNRKPDSPSGHPHLEEATQHAWPDNQSMKKGIDTKDHAANVEQ